MYGDQFGEFAFGYWGFGAVGLGAVFHLPSMEHGAFSPFQIRR